MTSLSLPARGSRSFSAAWPFAERLRRAKRLALLAPLPPAPLHEVGERSFFIPPSSQSFRPPVRGVLTYISLPCAVLSVPSSLGCPRVGRGRFCAVSFFFLLPLPEIRLPDVSSRVLWF